MLCYNCPCHIQRQGDVSVKEKQFGITDCKEISIHVIKYVSKINALNFEIVGVSFVEIQL